MWIARREREIASNAQHEKNTCKSPPKTISNSCSNRFLKLKFIGQRNRLLWEREAESRAVRPPFNEQWMLWQWRRWCGCLSEKERESGSRAINKIGSLSGCRFIPFWWFMHYQYWNLNNKHAMEGPMNIIEGWNCGIITGKRKITSMEMTQ